MELERNPPPTDRLYMINVSYFREFSESIKEQTLGGMTLYEEVLASLITDQFDKQSIEIITLRLLNQSSIDIALYMNIDSKLVDSILREAPSLLKPYR